MKTDLSKILSVSGQPGLYRYIAQSRTGAVVESLAGGNRTSFGMNSRMTTLEDISVYTDEGEVRLREVFNKMTATLDGAAAPSSKSSPEELKAFFEKALPGYDRDRFYVSHMKKVVDWYNLLRNNASVDFVDPQAEQE